MSGQPSDNTTKALTLPELLVVLEVIAILFLILLPQFARYQRPNRLLMLDCINNLKQLGVATRTWAIDNSNRLPAQVSAGMGGSMEWIASGKPTPHVRVMSNEISTPKLLYCPADTKKMAGTNFDAGLSDQNVSYFFSVDASNGVPDVILAGDRNLEIAGQPLKPGLALIKTSSALDWTRDFHYKATKLPCGNLLFADGHVECRVTNLADFVKQQQIATNRLAIP